MELLDFRLDDKKGVSNTFSVPYFDYNRINIKNRWVKNIKKLRDN